MKQSAENRFWSRVEQAEDDACWLWIGPVNGSGAGMFSCRGKNAPAYRWSYEWLVGPIPDGLYLDHRCRNRRCVNPAHLEPVTAAENNRRARAQRCSCPNCQIVAGRQFA